MELHLDISSIEYELHEALISTMGEVGKASKKVVDLIDSDLKRLGTDVVKVMENMDDVYELQRRWENNDTSLKQEFGISDEAWNEARAQGILPQEIKDALDEDIDTLFGLRQDILDKLDEKWQNYIDVIEYYINEYDRITDRLENKLSISDSILSIIETTGLNYKWGADESKPMFKNMMAQLDAVRSQAKVVTGELKMAEKTRDDVAEQLNKLLDGRTYAEFSQSAGQNEMFEFNRLKEFYDTQSDLVDELHAKQMELAAEAYEKAKDYADQWAEIISHDLDESLGAMFDSFDEAMDMYSMKYDVDHFFMDEYDKTFELNKLQREINKTIDDISNPEQLARYNALLAEIEEKKAEGVKMTEKDLEILQAQFDLEQARDAYEDARNAKNTMRLARDASGNYSYVYSADGNNVEDAEAKVEEAMHNIYKLHRDYADEMNEAWLQNQANLREYLKTVDIERYKYDESYKAEVDAMIQMYLEKSDLFANEVTKHLGAIDKKFSDTSLGVITNLESMEVANDLYKQNADQLKVALFENYNQWMDKADETRQEVGQDWEDLEDTIERATEEMIDEIGSLDAEIDKLNKDSTQYLSEMRNFIADWVGQVNSYFNSFISKIDQAIQKYRDFLNETANRTNVDDLINTDEEEYDENQDYSSLALAAYARGDMEKYNLYLRYRQRKMDDNPEGISSITEGKVLFNPERIDNVDNAMLDNIAKVYNENADLGREILGALQYLKGDKREYDFYGIMAKLNVYYSDVISKEVRTEILNALQDKAIYAGAATGGLVSTRQKIEVAEDGPELVLNAEDTQKILEAVKNVRALTLAQLSSAFQYQSQRASMISDMAAQAADLLSIRGSETAPQTVDQNVHIEASFPGIDTAAEVQEALNSLIVEAAHYSITNR